jgi:hypothetical protein
VFIVRVTVNWRSHKGEKPSCPRLASRQNERRAWSARRRSGASKEASRKEGDGQKVV